MPTNAQNVQTDDRKVIKQKWHTYYRIDEKTVDLQAEVEELLEIVSHGESKLELLVDGSKLAVMLTHKELKDDVERILSYASAVVIFRASPK